MRQHRRIQIRASSDPDLRGFPTGGTDQSIRNRLYIANDRRILEASIILLQVRSDMLAERKRLANLRRCLRLRDQSRAENDARNQPVHLVLLERFYPSPV